MKKLLMIATFIIVALTTFSQSEIILNVDNNVNYDYYIQVAFNQTVSPANGAPTIFQVKAFTSETIVYEFDEYDVNIVVVKCAPTPYAMPDAVIYTSSGTGTSVSVGPSYHFEFVNYWGQGIYETLWFEIN